MNAEKPLISIIIPTYNRPALLKKAIQTVLDQTYKNLEIIIVDDTSTLNNQKTIKCFDKKTVTYLKNKTRSGAPYSRNVGIKNAKGRFIAFLDDDDEWMSEKLEKQLEAFDGPDVGLVVCYSLDKRFGRERISKPPDNVDHNYLLKSFNLSSTSSYLVRKETLDKTGYFDVDLLSAQEYDLAMRISKHYKIKTIPRVLMIQNAAEGQISENWSKKIKGVMAIYRKHSGDYKALGTKDCVLNHVKVVGMIGLFFLGYIFGRKIHNIIVPVKESHEIKDDKKCKRRREK